jgi:hypothetical protein
MHMDVLDRDLLLALAVVIAGQGVGNPATPTISDIRFSAAAPIKHLGACRYSIP